MVRVAVAVDTPQHAGVGAVLDYLHGQALPPGTLVRVPLGRREVPGIVWPQGGRGADARGGAAPGRRGAVGAAAAAAGLAGAGGLCRRYYQRGAGELALAVLPPELRGLDGVRLARRLARLPAPAGEVAAAATEAEATTPTPASRRRRSPPGPSRTTSRPPRWPRWSGRRRHDAALRRHRQRQDRGLPAAGGARAGAGPPGAAAGARDQPHAAARGACARALPGPRAGQPAQRPDAGAALRHWLLAHLGRADLVLGTRMAVFAPLPRLGLIVVDEEHDPSFKQQEGARYSARDLAVWRGRHEGVPVLLGSATPSLESWAHAHSGRYRLLTLAERIGGGVMPRVRIVDTT
jgi:primosomal protein N' (replication factor Y) (superfamily II helicase)